MRIVDLPPFEQQLNERLPSGWGGRWYGVLPALVIDIKDPDSQGRVKVTLPWSVDAKGARYEAWARLATMLGGNNRGSWFIPDVDDEVLIAFENGDSRRPYVVGGLWNGRDSAPESMDGSGNNYKKVLRSRNGVKITLDDQDGQENMILENARRAEVHAQRRTGRSRDRGQQRQLGEARNLGHHHQCVRHGHCERKQACDQCRTGHRGCGHVQILRCRASRYRHLQQRGIGVIHAGRGKHLVSL